MTHLGKQRLPVFNGQTILVTRPFRLRLKLLTPLVLLLAVWCILSPAKAFAADAPNPNPGVLPPNATAFGKTYGAWSAAWWQYVLAQPTSSNPLNDLTGADCGVDQSGPVFFLVGTNGSGALTRNDCTVPSGKALFFPLVNVFDTHVPGDGLDTPEKVWADLQNNVIGPPNNLPNNLRGATSMLRASVDGVQVQDLTPATTPYLACAGPAQIISGATGCTLSPSFSITLPADNFFGVPAGVYSPTVADGFFLLLAPLTPGPHTIKFSGISTFVTQDITYHLTVLPS